MSNPDKYFGRSEVSNSDLTELKQLLYPKRQYGDKEAAFRFGTLVDALVTEPDRVNYYKYMVDDVLYSKEQFELGREMYRSLKFEARKDSFLAKGLELSDTQTCMVNQGQAFEYGPLRFTLDPAAKGCWWMP